MNNMTDEILKDSFRMNIHTALELATEPSITINFKFTDTKNKFKSIEKFEIFANSVRYKNVYLGETNNKNTINLMIKNMNYDKWAYIDMVEEHDKESCQGHGEYWGANKFTFIYIRL